MVREAVYEDLKAILELYLDLHEKAIPEESEHLESVWKQIITDRNHHFVSECNRVDDAIIYKLQELQMKI